MAGGKLTGAFVNTTNVWDVTQIYTTEVTSPEFKELLVRLYQNLNVMAQVVNIKDSGYYVLDEFLNGQKYFMNPALNSTTSTQPTFRQVLRKVINFGALPNTATQSVAHGITINQSYTFTRIYGAASDTTGLTYLPLPYASVVLANNIELFVDATNVNITTGANRSNYNVCYIVLEYITS
jgi:hypothetical protein